MNPGAFAFDLQPGRAADVEVSAERRGLTGSVVGRGGQYGALERLEALVDLAEGYLDGA